MIPISGTIRTSMWQPQTSSRGPLGPIVFGFTRLIWRRSPSIVFVKDRRLDAKAIGSVGGYRPVIASYAIIAWAT